jgi:hypothetical protein
LIGIYPPFGEPAIEPSISVRDNWPYYKRPLQAKH